MTASQPFPLRSLSSSTISHLRSTVNITSLSDALTELVQNSLDAGAAQVDCWINVDGWAVRVMDDGQGIGRAGMKTVGERYATSKASDTFSLSQIKTYGFRGEALASLASLSLLTITSRSSSSPSAPSYHKIIKGGEVLSNGVTKRLERVARGTTVNVEGLFYNVPVRRLSAAKTTDPFISNHPSQSISPETTITLTSCRKVIELAALSRPDVGFTLTLESDDPKFNLGIGGGGSGIFGGMKRILTVKKTDTYLSAFRNLFGRSLTQDFQEVKAATITAVKTDISGADNGEQMRIEGFVSFTGSMSKSYQSIFVNGFPLKRCDLHKTVERRFARTSFGRICEAIEDNTKVRTRQSPRRMDLKPVYVLHVKISPAKVDLTLEPRKRTVGFENWNTVDRFLASVIDGMLAKHGFKEELSLSRGNESSPIRSMAAQRSASHPGTRLGRSVGSQLAVSSIATPSKSRPTVSAPMGTRCNAGQSPTAGLATTQTKLGFSAGFSVSGKERMKREKKKVREMDEEVDLPWSDWLKATLNKPRPGITMESKIPALDVSDPDRDRSQWQMCSHGLNATKDHDVAAIGSSETFQSFEKQSLRNAVVIGQVDQKFICCSVIEGKDPAEADEQNRTIILIDQHAADERIRVEEILHSIAREFIDGGVSRTDLGEDPHLLLLSREEIKWLRASSDRLSLLSRWGFKMEVPTVDNDDGDAEDLQQAQVITVPKALEKRLSAQSSKEVKKIVQGFIATHQMEGLGGLLSLLEKGEAEASESSVLRWCPSRMLELVNSRACRGAIMFNDALTLGQCESLVAKLAETDFPFMCAHGRPSMIPLVAYDKVSSDRRHHIDWSKVRL